MRAATFAGTREVVYIEDTQLRSVCIFYFKYFYIGVIDRDIVEFRQCDSV